MREIKFRAWDSKYKAFVYVILDKTGPRYILPIRQSKNTSWSDWKQYTGLQDKNGKEIYEGDVIQYSDYLEGDRHREGGMGLVKFSEGEFCLVGSDGHWEGGVVEMIINDKAGVVIGNIYENPELCK